MGSGLRPAHRLSGRGPRDLEWFVPVPRAVRAGWSAVGLDPGRLRRHRPALHRLRGQRVRPAGPAGTVLPGDRPARPAGVPERAGRTPATYRRQLTTAHTRDSNMTTTPAASR